MKIAIVAVLIALGASLWAQAPLATIKDLSGKVELKKSGGAWVLASKGDALEKDTLISTGFKSSAVLALGESVLTVKPLTRLSLQDIARNSGDDKVSLYLLAGRVRAEVAKPVGGQVVFSVKSPTATASVRGTGFDMDTANLTVFSGTVAFSGAAGGPTVPVSKGQSSGVASGSEPSRPVSAESQQASPPPAPAGVDPAAFTSAVSSAGPATPAASTLGSVSVSVGW